MTMTAIDCIGKYTNVDEYELIVVDPEPSEAIRDDYHVLPQFTWLKPSPDPDYSACMNLGAEQAKGEYLVFIQNDVFVQENWLPGLRQYIEGGFDVVFPDQVPRDRKYVLDSYKRLAFEPESMKGGRDAGLIMMTKKIFKKVGGWNPELSLLTEGDMYQRLGKVGARWTDTNKVFITHIMGGTNWTQHANDREEYNRRMDKDAKLLNG